MASRFTERYAPSEILPGFDLNKLTRAITEFEVSEVRFGIDDGRQVIVYRVNSNHCVVNTIKPFTINPEDRISQTQSGPWRCSDFIDVLKDKPICFKFFSELLDSREYFLPNIVARRPAVGKLLDGQQSFSEKLTG